MTVDGHGDGRQADLRPIPSGPPSCRCRTRPRLAARDAGPPARSRPASPILGPAPPDRGGIARETALARARSFGRGVDVRWFTFSRRYPRWLDPRRFDVDPRLWRRRTPQPVLDYRSPLSWKRTAEAIASRGAEALLVPWWTAFWGLPRAVLRRLRAPLAVDAARPALPQRRGPRGRSASPVPRARGVSRGRRLRRPRRGGPRPARAARAGPAGARPAAPRRRPSAAPAPRGGARGGSASRGPLVLFLGLVRRYKGVDLLLDAAPEIVRRDRRPIAVVGEVFPDARELAAPRGGEPRARPDPAGGTRTSSEEEMASGSRPATSSCSRTARSRAAASRRARSRRAGRWRRPQSAASRRRSSRASRASSSPPGDAGAPRARGRDGARARRRRVRAGARSRGRTRVSWPRYVGRAPRVPRRSPSVRVARDVDEPTAASPVYSASHESRAHRGAAAPPDLGPRVRRGGRPARGPREIDQTGEFPRGPLPRRRASSAWPASPSRRSTAAPGWTSSPTRS